MFLFDTNLVSDLRRPERLDPRAARAVSEIPEGAVHLSAVTVFELERGVVRMERRDPEQGAVLRAWLEAVVDRHAARILPVDAEVARVCAALHVPDPRPLADSLIAATAIRHGLTVATRNVRDFAGTGAALFDPGAGGAG